MSGFRYIEEVVTLAYDREKCVGCGACGEVCPHGVFKAERGSKAELLDRGGCMECGACAANCPSQAITVKSGVGCAQAILASWVSHVPFLKKTVNPDSCEC